MIIIEGPDGAGKTTLRDKINTDWSGEFVIQQRAVTSDAVSMVPIGTYIDTELNRGFGPRLYDRFALISSPCYMMLPNRTFVDPMTDPLWLQMQHHKMRRVDPAIIYCLPPLDVVMENVMRDSSSKVMHDHAEQVYLNYVAYIARDWSTSSMIYDYTKPDIRRLNNLLHWAHARITQERL